MDDLFGLLITIVMVGLAFSNKKKKSAGKKEPAARRTAGAKAPAAAEEFAALVKQQIQKAADSAAPRKEISRPKKPAPTPDPVLLVEHDEPEGSISTQGETDAEHEAHRSRILAEEIRLREEHNALQDLKKLNLQKLRSAVVMSEVLGKPVSLRPRGYR